MPALFRQRHETGFVGAGHEAAGHQDAVLRVAHAREHLGAGKLLAAHVDLRLIPELDPVVLERVRKADARLGRLRETQLLLADDRLDGRRLEWLLEHREHPQLMLLADVLEVFKHRGAAVAHELHRAGVAELAQRLERLDRVAGIQVDTEEYQVRRPGRARGAERFAVGEFHGVDADALQDQRYEMADAALFVDDEAERGALLTGFCKGSRWRVGGHRRGHLRFHGHRPEIGPRRVNNRLPGTAARPVYLMLQRAALGGASSSGGIPCQTCVL